MTFSEWLLHLKQWWYTCPIFDTDPHCYTGRLGSNERTCIVCKKTIIEEKDEEELEQDKRIQEAFKDVDWESLESK